MKDKSMESILAINIYLFSTAFVKHENMFFLKLTPVARSGNKRYTHLVVFLVKIKSKIILT